MITIKCKECGKIIMLTPPTKFDYFRYSIWEFCKCNRREYVIERYTENEKT